MYSTPAKKFGARLKKMLVCQPHVTEMDVSVNCCNDSSVTFGWNFSARRRNNGRTDVPAPTQDEAKFDKVKNEEGVTVGDLYAACQRLAEQHHLCPRAPVHAFDRTGRF